MGRRWSLLSALLDDVLENVRQSLLAHVLLSNDQGDGGLSKRDREGWKVVGIYWSITR